MPMPATCPLTSPPQNAAGQRAWSIALLLLVIVECIPFWLFQYFPSQDGPSHLYNALVLARYGQEPLYRQYYFLTVWNTAGNVLTQLMLAALIHVVSPLIAEKILLSGYVVLLFGSFRYLFGAVTPHAGPFACSAGLVVSNLFLFKGFQNFCYSIPLALLIIGYAIRRRQRWTAPALGLLLAGGLIVYFTHVVSWVLCVMGVAALEASELVLDVFSRRKRLAARTWRAAFLQSALPVLALLPAAVLLLVHLTRSTERPLAIAEPWRDRVWALYSLEFLRTPVESGHLVIAKAITATLLMLALFVAGAALWRRLYNLRSTAFLALSGICGGIALFGPDAVGSGSYIHDRVGLYACIFFLLWLAGALTRWPRAVANAFGMLSCGIALSIVAASIPVISDWNRALQDFVQLGRSIRPGSTVLTATLERPAGDLIDPYRHAVDLLYANTLIDLGDYEASKDYFSVRFRPDRSPFPALFTVEDFEAVPSVFDICRYQSQTGGRVDYLLFLDPVGPIAAGRMDGLVRKLYGDQMAAYSPVELPVMRHTAVRLYRRTASTDGSCRPGGAKPGGNPHADFASPGENASAAAVGPAWDAWSARSSTHLKSSAIRKN